MRREARRRAIEESVQPLWPSQRESERLHDCCWGDLYMDGTDKPAPRSAFDSQARAGWHCWLRHSSNGLHGWLEGILWADFSPSYSDLRPSPFYGRLLLARLSTVLHSHRVPSVIPYSVPISPSAKSSVRTRDLRLLLQSVASPTTYHACITRAAKARSC